MKLEDWFNLFYFKILSDFGFDERKDVEAAKLMHELAKNKLLDKSVLAEKISGKDVAIIGGAVDSAINAEVVITAGKAIGRWLKICDIIPDVHVTDIEESTDILVKLQDMGTILVLHAHGDNMDRIRDVIPKLRSFVGTTQHKPFNKIYNFGGFTDGDRAAIIAKEFNAKKIILHGFHFHSIGVKGKKLMWAKKILEFEGIL